MKSTVTDSIEIGDVVFRRGVGTPTSFLGKHSGKELARIEMEFIAKDSKTISDVKRVFTGRPPALRAPNPQSLPLIFFSNLKTVRSSSREIVAINEKVSTSPRS